MTGERRSHGEADPERRDRFAVELIATLSLLGEHVEPFNHQSKPSSVEALAAVSNIAPQIAERSGLTCIKPALAGWTHDGRVPEQRRADPGDRRHAA